MDRNYVSEFSQFIAHFLEEHPEVVRDQWVGREIYWDKSVDFRAQKEAGADKVPEDGYGFSYAAWCDRKKRLSPSIRDKDPGTEASGAH